MRYESPGMLNIGIIDVLDLFLGSHKNTLTLSFPALVQTYKELKSLNTKAHNVWVARKRGVIRIL